MQEKKSDHSAHGIKGRANLSAPHADAPLAVESSRPGFHTRAVPSSAQKLLLGQQKVGPYDCYVVAATPRRKDKYLFEGRIWISKGDFGIVRIAGHPARKLSFWIERVDFVRQYEKIGPFWLPQRDSTVAKVRFNGKKIFTIDHEDYIINGQPSERISAEIRPRTLAEAIQK